MAPLIKTAYFDVCQEKGCTMPHEHGDIVCTDGSRASCHSKQRARACVEEFLKQGLIAPEEKGILMEQIDRSPLAEFSAFPTIVYRTAEQNKAKPFIPAKGMALVGTTVDDVLAAKLR